jgi:hypothetical protein
MVTGGTCNERRTPQGDDLPKLQARMNLSVEQVKDNWRVIALLWAAMALSACTDENNAPLCDPTHHADAGCKPSASRSGQSMDALAMAAANDHARAEKANPSQDALDDATDGVDLATIGHRHDGERGA